MKRLVLITGIILAVCLFAGVYAAPSGAVQTPETLVQTSQLEQTGGVQIYILKAENGRLAVYKKGEDKPYIQTQTNINNLPQGDILRLEKGIEVSGEDNLRKSLEDYCS